MLEIKTLCSESRAVLFKEFEYYSYLLFNKNKKNIKLFNTLTITLKEKGINTKRLENELWVFVTHYTKCLRYKKPGYMISLDAKDYRAASKLLKTISVRESRMKELLIILDELECITLYLGYWFKSIWEREKQDDIVPIDSHLTCIKIEQLLTNMLLNVHNERSEVG